MIYKCESKDNIFKIFGEKFINNNREKYIIKYKNKIYPLQAYFPIHVVEDEEKQIEIFLFELENKHYKKLFYYFNNLNKILLEFEKNNNNIDIKNDEKILDSEQNIKKYEEFYNKSGIIGIGNIETIINNSSYTNEITLLEIYQSILSLNNKSKKKFCNCCNMSYMFYQCSLLISAKNISEWDTSKVTDMSLMFYGCSSLISLPDLSNWNILNVNSLFGTFFGCSLIKSIPGISNWNPNNLLYMSHLFDGCSSLIYIPDISHWNTSNIIDMSSLFRKCSSLVSLPDISKWNTENTKNLREMFRECSSLTILPNISNWDITHLDDVREIFYECKSLISLPNISKWKSLLFNKDDMLINCFSLISLPDVSEWKYFSLTYNSNIFEGCFSILNHADDNYYNH